MVYQQILKKGKLGKKQLAVLIDPDESKDSSLDNTLSNAVAANADYIFVGGSLLMSDDLDEYIARIKSLCELPVVIFPGSPTQISSKADGILFLSLISGRNPELLIGHHVVAAPLLKKTNLEILSTGYMLIDGGRPTTVSYISNTDPIPPNKPSIAACTAMAGEMLGMKLIYMDCGSGADHSVPVDMIAKVDKSVSLPIIVGGGIRTGETAKKICDAGADIVVVGTAAEKDASVLKEISAAIS